MYLETNRCHIKLTKEESDYIKNCLIESDMTEKSIVKIITEFYYNSKKRYYKKEHVLDISQNLHKKIKILKEDIGRNLRSRDNLSGNNSSNITDKDILNRNDIVNAEIGVCVNSNSDIVTLYFKDRENEIKYFDSPESASQFIQHLRYKNL